MSAIVLELWRYPVKSILGERVKEIELEPRGLRGDRQFAVTDRGGKIGSGDQWMSWVDIDDVVSAIEWAMERDDARGVYNVTSPEPSATHTRPGYISASVAIA